MAIFYDTHAHLDYPDFASELPEVIERAKAAGIQKIVTIATSLESSERAVKIAERFANVYAAVGCHPSDVMDAPEDIRPALRTLAAHPKVVALGETGLDYYRLPGGKGGPKQIPEVAQVTEEAERLKRKQIEIFQQHLEVAAETGLNCVVHQRDSLEDTLTSFEPYASRVRAVFHCFANDAATMRRILALGSLVSFTGILTFKTGQIIRDTVAATPMDGFMLETDSPFLAPMPYRGKRCEPAYVRETAVEAARVKGCSLDELSQATCATAEKFFAGIA